MSRWSKNGGPPQELPFQDAMPDGTLYTGLANNPEGRAALGWVALPPDPPGLPAEIPMYKATKALRRLGPGGEVVDQDDTSWWDLAQAVIAQIPDKIARGDFLDDLDRAPNLVLADPRLPALRTAIGMSTEQFEAVAWLALSLP